MMSMVEKMARAAYEKYIEDVRDLEPSWEGLPQSHRDRMITSQRAAIEAMRELPDNIWKLLENADEEAEWMDSHKAVRHLHNLMIDAALNEQVAG